MARFWTRLCVAVLSLGAACSAASAQPARSPEIGARVLSTADAVGTIVDLRYSAAQPGFVDAVAVESIEFRRPGEVTWVELHPDELGEPWNTVLEGVLYSGDDGTRAEFRLDAEGYVEEAVIQLTSALFNESVDSDVRATLRSQETIEGHVSEIKYDESGLVQSFKVNVGGRDIGINVDRVNRAFVSDAITRARQEHLRVRVIYNTTGCFAFGNCLVSFQILEGDTHGLSTPPCARADLAAPRGVLDLADAEAFAAGFAAGLPVADLAAPLGVLNADDVDAFASDYLAGCP